MTKTTKEKQGYRETSATDQENCSNCDHYISWEVRPCSGSAPILRQRCTKGQFAVIKLAWCREYGSRSGS